MSDVYLVGQGKVYMSFLDVNRKPIQYRYVGNVPSFEVSLETDVVEHKESYSGQRQIDLRFNRQNTAKVQVTLEDWDKDNLKLMLYGDSQVVTGASVTNELTATGITAGGIYKTANMGISTVTITDSASSPVTLVAGTNYTVTDATAGLITFTNVGTYTQPFKVNYTFAANEIVRMFTQGLTDIGLLFYGINTTNSAVSNKPFIVELYRTSFSPTKSLSLIGDDVAKFELDGTVLYDDTKASNGLLGGFGRIIETPSFTL